MAWQLRVRPQPLLLVAGGSICPGEALELEPGKQPLSPNRGLWDPNGEILDGRAQLSRRSEGSAGHTRRGQGWQPQRGSARGHTLGRETGTGTGAPRPHRSGIGPLAWA